MRNVMECFSVAEFQADSRRVASPKDTEVFRLHRGGRGGHLRQEGGQALDEAHSPRQGEVGPDELSFEEVDEYN